MRVGSLFSGVGGLDLGLELAGHEIVWQVEFDKQAQSVLRHHWPNVDLYKDVRDVGFRSRAECEGQGDRTTHIRGESAVDDSESYGGGAIRGDNEQQRTTRSILEPVDLICGGFPCQDVSVAGSRAGLAGERSGLWWEFHRIISELTPTWVLIENVPCLLSFNEGRDSGAVVHGLEELRYGWSYRICDSQYFGVAQRRRRVFIVGHLGGPCPPEILLESDGLLRDSAPSRKARQDTAGSLGGRAAGEGGQRNDLDNHGAYPLAHTLGAHDFKGPGHNRDGNVIAHTLTGCHGSEDGTGRGVPVVAFNWQNGGGYGDANEGLGVSEDHSPPLSSSQTPAVSGKKSERHPPVREVAHTIGTRNAYGNSERGDDSGNLVVEVAETPAVFRKAQKAHDPDDHERWEEASCTNTLSGHGTTASEVALSFQERGREGGRNLEVGGDVAYSLNTPDGGGRANENNVLAPVVPLDLRNATRRADDMENGVGIGEEGDPSPTLTGIHVPGVAPTYHDTTATLTESASGVSRPGFNGEAEFVVGAIPRRLTPTECERLQGFPDGWTAIDGMADGPRYRMMGNAVTVNVAEWIGRRFPEPGGGDV